MMIRGVDMADGEAFMTVRVSEGMPLHEVVGLTWTLHEDAKRQTRDCFNERDG